MPKMTQIISLLAAVLLCLAQTVSAQLTPGSSSLLGGDQPQPLRKEEAFPYFVSISGPDTITVNWQLADGHYLYRRQFAFSLKHTGEETAEPVEFALPDGLKKQDQFFGDIEAYYDNVTATLTLNTDELNDATLVIRYQGCADWGFCYPPQTDEFPFNP